MEVYFTISAYIAVKFGIEGCIAPMMVFIQRFFRSKVALSLTIKTFIEIERYIFSSKTTYLIRSNISCSFIYPDTNLVSVGPEEMAGRIQRTLGGTIEINSIVCFP